MPVFLCPALADLTRQLNFAPAHRVREQMHNAEELYWQLEPDRSYPMEFITFRLTRFRTQALPQLMLAGAAVRRDLLTLVETLSESIGDRLDAYSPPPLGLDEVCERLGVTAKTVSRYRREGLFSRRLIGSDGKTRLGFLPGSVERFEGAMAMRLERASRFSRIDEPAAHAMVMRARRIRSRVDVSPFAVARHLSRKFGRSVETIRLLLLRHDRHDPRVAIFPEHSPALGERDLRVIYRAYRRGVRVSRLAERFARSRNVIYRAINLRRAAELMAMDLRCVSNPTFDLPDAEEVILHSTPPPVEAVGTALDAPTESSLFARYNFLKYRAIRLREQLDRHHPRASSLDAIETYLRRATATKEQIVGAFLRLVASVAHRHMTGARATAMRSDADLIGDGSVVLLETIETFDPSRGNRFSTYLSWALMRRFARVESRGTARLTRDVVAEESAASGVAIPEEESIAPLLSNLNERERYVLTRHFGLSDDSGSRVQPQTLAQIARELGISAERARRIERAAMNKLRKLKAVEG